MHIQGDGSRAVEAATAFDFGFQFAAVRVLADIHGRNAPKKVAPINPKGDGPAMEQHQWDLTKLSDETARRDRGRSARLRDALGTPSSCEARTAA